MAESIEGKFERLGDIRDKYPPSTLLLRGQYVLNLQNKIKELKEKIAQLEEERRWRTCGEEMPPTDGSYMCAYKNKNKDDGVLFVDEAVWDGEKWSYKFDFWEDIIYWQFKPKAPEVGI